MDPQRFDEGDATEFERRLFEAAQREIPSITLKARMQQGLGLAAGPVAVSVAAKSLALSWKLGAFLGLAVIGTVATVSLVEKKGRQPASTETSPVILRPVSAELPQALQPSQASIDEAARRDSVAPRGDSSFIDEIHLLDRARAALSGGDPRRTLEVLEQYDRQHARGRLCPEAVALRIQALYAAGDAQSARALGRKFLADYPTNPLAERVTRLMRP